MGTGLEERLPVDDPVGTWARFVVAAARLLNSTPADPAVSEAARVFEGWNQRVLAALADPEFGRGLFASPYPRDTPSDAMVLVMDEMNSFIKFVEVVTEREIPLDAVYPESGWGPRERQIEREVGKKGLGIGSVILESVKDLLGDLWASMPPWAKALLDALKEAFAVGKELA